MAKSSRSSAIFTSKLSLFLLLLSLYDVHCDVTRECGRPSTYRVAVFEHAAMHPQQHVANRDMALGAMRKNIQIYNATIIKARRKGVKLLTFPEYGICGGFRTRRQTSLYAETIPDTMKRIRNPCEDPEFKGKETEVQRIFSCIARHNEMFLVINMIARETCYRNEAGCPPDGQYLYNANFVFSPKGEIVARYYKTHLCLEPTLNPAKSPEIAIFDTPFGKFGTFINLDLVFEKPFIELIEKYNIRNIAFPTAWIDQPPMTRSIQVHPAFARGCQVNLLVANLNRKATKSAGSGIYSPNGALKYSYNPYVERSQLIIADIQQINNIETRSFGAPSVYPQEAMIKNKVTPDMFTETIPFKYKKLRRRRGHIKVCQGSICCKSSYAIKRPFRETYALGVYEGYFLIADDEISVEACVLLKCPFGMCGREITTARTQFEHFSIQRVGFSSKYMLPSVLAIHEDQLMLVPKTWSFSRKKGMQTRRRWNKILHTACYVGRDDLGDFPEKRV